jgi:hypothetical protein
MSLGFFFVMQQTTGTHIVSFVGPSDSLKLSHPLTNLQYRGPHNDTRQNSYAEESAHREGSPLPAV